MKIIYNNENDIAEFDMQRYLKSLNRYGEVTEKQVIKGLEDFPYDPLHVSCLVELAIRLLPEDKAKEYYEDHQIDNNNFERLRRITGYLVGSLERWNSAKQSEEKARVKHNIDGYKYDKASGQYTLEEKDEREALKIAQLQALQI